MDKSLTRQIKGLAIILVVFGHLGIIDFGAAWGVSLFLFLSGFGIYQSFRQKGLDNYLLNRGVTIMVPFGLVMLFEIIADHLFFEKNYDVQVMVLTFLGMDYHATVDPTMWYISFLLIWYIACYVIFQMQIPDSIRLLMLFFAGACLIFAHNHLFSKPVVSLYYTFYFPSGVLFSYYYARFSNIGNKRKIIWLSLILSVCFLIFLVVHQYFSSSNKFVLILSHYISCWMFVGCTVSIFLLLSQNIIRMNIKPLSFLGSLSYDLYLVEGCFIMKYLEPINGFSRLLVSFCCMLGSALILHHIQRPLVGFLRRNSNLQAAA